MLEPIIIVVGGWWAVNFGGMWEREVLSHAQAGVKCQQSYFLIMTFH